MGYMQNIRLTGISNDVHIIASMLFVVTNVKESTPIKYFAISRLIFNIVLLCFVQIMLIIKKNSEFSEKTMIVMGHPRRKKNH